MKKILITGVTGFAGYKIYNYLKARGIYEVRGIGRSSGGDLDFVCDLTDSDSVRSIRDHFFPDVVIHLAAMARTDMCENNKEECYAANVVSTRNLAEIFPDSKFIYFSTYAVYNTTEGNCDESCEISHTNFYIKTKIEAEKHVNALKDYIIFRPSVIFGYMPLDIKTKNYFMQLLDMVRNRKVMRSPADQYFNPVLVDVVADIVCSSIENDISGTYNIGSNENVSKYEFNRMIMERFGFDQKYLEPAAPGSDAVQRPVNGTISSQRIQSELSYSIPGISVMIESLYNEIRDEPVVMELK